MHGICWLLGRGEHTVSAPFARLSRVGSIPHHASCLHESKVGDDYDEQRERKMRSILSLLRKQSQKDYEICTMLPSHTEKVTNVIGDSLQRTGVSE